MNGKGEMAEKEVRSPKLEKKPIYETPKAIRIDELNRGLGGTNGSSAGCYTGSSDVVGCEDGSLPGA